MQLLLLQSKQINFSSILKIANSSLGIQIQKMIEESLFLQLVQSMTSIKNNSKNVKQPSKNLLNLLQKPGSKILLNDIQDPQKVIDKLSLETLAQQKQSQKQIRQLENGQIQYFVKQIYKRRRPTQIQYLKLKQFYKTIQTQKQIHNFDCIQELQNVITSYEQFITKNQALTKQKIYLSLLQELTLLKQEVSNENQGKLQMNQFTQNIPILLMKINTQLNKKYTQTQKYGQKCIEEKQTQWIDVQAFCSLIITMQKYQDQQILKAEEINEQIVDLIITIILQMVFRNKNIKQYSSKELIVNQYLTILSYFIGKKYKFTSKLLGHFVTINQSFHNKQEKNKKSVNCIIKWITESHFLPNEVKQNITKTLIQDANQKNIQLVDQQLKSFVKKTLMILGINQNQDKKLSNFNNLFVIKKEEDQILSLKQISLIAQQIFTNYQTELLKKLAACSKENQNQNQNYNFQTLFKRKQFSNLNEEVFHNIIACKLFSAVFQFIRKSKKNKQKQNYQNFPKILELFLQKQSNLAQSLIQRSKQVHQNFESSYISNQNLQKSLNFVCYFQLITKKINFQILSNQELLDQNLKKLSRKLNILHQQLKQIQNKNKGISSSIKINLIKLCLKNKISVQKFSLFLNYLSLNIQSQSKQQFEAIMEQVANYLNQCTQNKVTFKHSLQIVSLLLQKTIKSRDQFLLKNNHFEQSTNKLFQLSSFIQTQISHHVQNQKCLFFEIDHHIVQHVQFYCQIVQILYLFEHLKLQKKQSEYSLVKYADNLKKVKNDLNQIQKSFYLQINPRHDHMLSATQATFFKAKTQIDEILINYNQSGIKQANQLIKDFQKMNRNDQFEIFTSSSIIQKLLRQTPFINQSLKFTVKKNQVLSQLNNIWTNQGDKQAIINVILNQNIKKFQFFSPTFNDQLLIFNSIYNSPDQIYFYQNHFYQHINLQIYQILINQIIQQEDTQKIYLIFEQLRSQLGKLIESSVFLAQSHHFYTILSILKYCSLTFTQKFLVFIDLQEMCTFFNLILEFIKKDNHPLLRQYIQIILGRVYLSIGRKSQQKRRQLRNKIINMLQIELNTGVPILFLLGYELIEYTKIKLQNMKQPSIQQEIKHKQKDLEDGYGSFEIKNKHQADMHFILVKFISCHTAYLRAICQYYLSKYLELQPQPDQLLVNLSKFWKEDKDSNKILANISIAVEGYRNSLQGNDDTKYLGFERVQQYPTDRVKYELNCESIQFLQRINIKKANKGYLVQKLINNRIKQLKQFNVSYIKNSLLLIKQKNNPKKQVKEATLQKKVVRQKYQNKKIQEKIIKKQQTKQKNAQIQVQIEVIDQIQSGFSQVSFKFNLIQESLKFNSSSQPKVIIIASLLEKVHNFGYLMRTLTSHSAILTVPSKQPLLHPQCQQLIPKDMDVQVIQIRKQELKSFIQLQKLNGYPLIALQQCSKSISLQKMVFPEKYMLLLGNERIGAPGSLLNLADILVQIPQVGKIRSLNVHVSMVICFWEYLKQKKESKQLKEVSQTQKK